MAEGVNRLQAAVALKGEELGAVLASLGPNGNESDRLAAVVLVTAGRSSAERLRTTTELLRSAGLALPFALMLSSDEYDESLGLPDQPDTGEGNARKAAQ